MQRWLTGNDCTIDFTGVWSSDSTGFFAANCQISAFVLFYLRKSWKKLSVLYIPNFLAIFQ
jgi:hypothetical protein